MAIVQKNLFLPGQNLTNMGLNVDLNAFSDDKTYITVNFGTSPATVSVKVGSIIEANGNRYTIESADYSFQMANTTDNYIVFDGTIFKSSSSVGTLDTAKQGFYQGGSNTERTIKWFVDQANQLYKNCIKENEVFTSFRAYASGTIGGGIGATVIVPFDTVDFDYTSSFNPGTYTYTIPHDGEYEIQYTCTLLGAVIVLSVFLNGTTQIFSNYDVVSTTTARTAGNIIGKYPFNAGDTLVFRVNAVTQPITVQAGTDQTHISIQRV